MIVKVCGMREAENMLAVAAGDIQWMGFIFYPKSARYYTAQAMVLPDRIRRVGVFVNAPIEEMLRKMAQYRLDYLQLHGDESPDVCRALSGKARLIKAISIASADDLRKADAYEGLVDYFLFDTKCDGYGGSGRRFDWSVLDSYQGATPFLLSGGIAPDSIAALRSFRHPKWAGIDLNSGFETTPGIKDASALHTFIHQLKTKES